MPFRNIINQLLLTVIITALATNQAFSEINGTTSQDVGDNWAFLGDSQTSGRAKQKHAISHAIIAKNIYEDTFNTRVYQLINGKSGRTLEGTFNAYENLTNPNQLSWIHIQESGNQLSGKGSQATPEKYSSQLSAFLLSIAKNSPNAIVTIETAYSFEAESMIGRDWSEHNKALIETVNDLNNAGLNVSIIDIDKNIKSLVNTKRRELGKVSGQQAVWGDKDNKIKRHYTGLGNLMVALSIFDKLSFDVGKLNLSSIPDSEISQLDKQLCINILK